MAPLRAPIDQSVLDAWQGLRRSTPLVQCITNSVVTNFTANVLLALGASPAMCDIVGEAGAFAQLSDGVLINLGTPTPEQRDAAREAVSMGPPWVLDPVGVGPMPIRTTLARQLLLARPSIVRGNASEILALTEAGTGGRGVDSTDDPARALGPARELALSTGGAVAISGPVDLITDGRRVIEVHGGDVMLTRITGGGCSLGATMAAFLAVAPPLDAAVTASAVHSAAAEHARSVASGPGSFAVAFIDAMAVLTAEVVVSPDRFVEHDSPDLLEDAGPGDGTVGVTEQFPAAGVR